jgi:hypothetical protein
VRSFAGGGNAEAARIYQDVTDASKRYNYVDIAYAWCDHAGQ